MSPDTATKTKLKGWQIVVIFVVVLLVWVCGWVVPRWLALTPEASGLMGDTFGAVNALFSGLAFAGLIVTLIMQREELALQRYEMQQMREQYERSAEAQEASERVLRDQLIATNRASIIRALASMLDAHAAGGIHGNSFTVPNEMIAAREVTRRLVAQMDAAQNHSAL